MCIVYSLQRYRNAKKFSEQKLPDNNHDLFFPIFLIIIFFALHLFLTED